MTVYADKHRPAPVILQSFCKETLDKTKEYLYNNQARFGVWRSLVSRLVRDQEASGSNPDTPTKIKNPLMKIGGFLILY